MPQPSTADSHIMGVYSRANLAFERGEGVWLYTAEGDAYLDAVAGIATTALGHANPLIVKALTDQASKLWHVSNIFQIPGQETLARTLCDAPAPTPVNGKFSAGRLARTRASSIRWPSAGRRWRRPGC